MQSIARALTFATFAIFFGLTALANKYAVVVGGSGEDFKDENFFLSDFDRFNKSLARRGFSVTTVFDQSKTKGLFQTTTATNSNIETAIKNVFSRAKEGDEVAIFFHAHGYEQPYFFPGHSVLTETADGFATAHLLPMLNSTKANVLVTDLSCYSGETQSLINFEKRKSNDHRLTDPIEEENSKYRLCIMTAASPNYVSICSGDKASNSFTAALLDGLETKKDLTAERLFNTAREQDHSFTNMPQISSFPEALKNPWDNWLRKTDPAGIADNDDMEAKPPCLDCEERHTRVVDKYVANVAKTLGDRSPKALLDSYRDAVNLQYKLNQSFKTSVLKAFADLGSQTKYKTFKDWSYGKTAFYAELKNIPSLEFKNGHPVMTKEVTDFLNGFGYLSDQTKDEMMRAMSSKDALNGFMTELQKKIGPSQDARDENRKTIQGLAAKILAYERQKYAQAFKSGKGNACQKFRF